MLNQKQVYEFLKKNDISFFTGVPDSYLNGFCNHLTNYHKDKNVIAANEGNAIAIAAGYYFSTKKLPLVYFQNSGLGNSVNPLVSLVDENVYSVPMILLIGWRGQPGTTDWPQHYLQGQITTSLLESMNIKYDILSDDIDDFRGILEKASSYCITNRKAFAILSPKGVMDGEKMNEVSSDFELTREEAIEIILDNFPSDTIYCATTGRATRELFFLRKRRNENSNNDFLNVGSMGHASSVALGIAIQKEDRDVVVLDGDSSAIMHMGSLTMASKYNLPNYTHIILNNGVHESVGGQPSAGFNVDFNMIAKGSGYFSLQKPVLKKEDLVNAIKIIRSKKQSGFIDIHINKGLKQNLPPLDFNHKEAIDSFINNLNQ